MRKQIVDVMPQPGRLIVERDRPSEVTDGGVIAKPQNVLEEEAFFESIATVLRVGDPRVTEYGHSVQTNVQPGDRVLLSNTGTRELTVSNGEVSQTWTIVPFECVIAKLVEAEESPLASPEEVRALQGVL